MCIFCTFQIILQVGVILACIQFVLWFISAGVYICSRGKYGLHVERYTRLALCLLSGGTVFTYLLMLGIMLGNYPDVKWPQIVMANLSDLIVTDYEYIEMHTSKMTIKYVAEIDLDGLVKVRDVSNDPSVILV